MTKNIKLQQRSLMRLVVIFSVFLPFYCYGRANPLYYQKMAKEKRQESQSAKQADFNDLESIAEDLEEDKKKLLFTLTHEHTREEEKLRIIEILSQTALFDKKVEFALDELVSRGSECENKENQTSCHILDIVSLEAHAELIRRKVESVAQLNQESRNYYKDMALDGVLIIAGAGLLFIPVGGPFLTTALFTVRVASVGKFALAPTVTGIGLYRVGREVIGGEDEDLKNVFEFVKGAIAANILTKAIFYFAQIGDEELLEKIVLSSSASEVIDLLYSVIEDGFRSDETRSVAIEALLAFPEELQIRRTRTTQLLMKMADKDPNDLELDVRISAVKVLGKIGERVSEVAEYLAEKGKGQSKAKEFLVETEDEKEVEDELRLIALVQSGRNRAYFDNSIEELDNWIEKSSRDDNKSFLNNLNIKLEIPEAFLNFLLSAKEDKVKEGEKATEKLHQHIIVLREFILSEIIDIETKLKFSEILIDWAKNNAKSEEIREIKAFLKAIWKNPAEDIGLYVEQLQEQKPTEETKPAFEFLKTRIEEELKQTVKNPEIPKEIVLDRIKSMVSDTGTFDQKYPNQKEIAENLRVFVEDYQKIQEIIKNQGFDRKSLIYKKK